MQNVARIALVGLFLVSTSALVLGSQTGTPAPTRPPVPTISVADLNKALGEAETIVATIVTIDEPNRMVVLRTREGVERVLFVGPGVTRLKEVGTGRVVKITYYMSLASEVLAPGAAATTGTTSSTVGTAGVTPGGTVSEQARWVVTVNSVDQNTRIVTVTTEEGRTLRVKAANQARIAQLKPNDRIQVVLTSAAVVSVEPVPAQ